MQLMLWDDVRVFLAVQRRGSHKGAARLLSVDATTVARRMAALEASLATPLFVRTPEGLQLTSAGELLAVHAARMETEALAGERALVAADPRLQGALRVTAADGFVNYVLLPALAELRREQPLLRLEVAAEARVLDLSRREADVAVRLLRPREPALVARRLGQLKMALFSSREYLEQHGTPRSLASLAAHAWVGFDASLDGSPQLRWLRKVVPDPRYVLRVNSTTAQVLACAEGHGVALLPTFVAAREPRLVPLLPRLVGPCREMWGVSHLDLRDNPRVIACLSWLGRIVRDASSDV